MTQDSRPPVIDALMPPEMAHKAERVGADKAARDSLTLFVLAVLAGAYIAFGAIFSTVAVAGAGDALPYGVTRLLAGVVFSLGLILVVIGGAELFTGDNLIVMAAAAGKVSFVRLMRVWGIVYLGNLVGSVGTAILVSLSRQYQFGDGAVARAAIAIADAKGALGYGDAFWLGILCNVLVCLAVWMCFSARTVTGKVMVIVPPIAAFVAAGFEHSIANMYFLTIAILIVDHAPPTFLFAAGIQPQDFAHVGLEWAIANLIPVTLGNIVGGGVLVGLVYWFVYLRPRRGGKPA